MRYTYDATTKTQLFQKVRLSLPSLTVSYPGLFRVFSDTVTKPPFGGLKQHDFQDDLAGIITVAGAFPAFLFSRC
jgi:hypothetical protein